MKPQAHPVVFIVDDDDAVRDSIIELVDSVGVNARGYESAQAFLDDYDADRPGCLVLDVRMAGMSGLALQDRLNAIGATIPVIMLSAHGDVPMAVEAMQKGAMDFIQKPYRDQKLLDSINRALARDSEVRARKAANQHHVRNLETLTPREREILDRSLAGLTSKAIAREFDVSPRTVETHRQNVLRKLGVNSIRDLIIGESEPPDDDR